MCKGLGCTDAIDGAYADKRRFLIFDYCGNFEFFRANKEGYEGQDPPSLTEQIFAQRVRLMMALQEDAAADVAYRTWRAELVEVCHGQVVALNDALVAVRSRRRTVEKFRECAAWERIGEGDKGELLRYLAPLIAPDYAEESAKRFDNLLYGLMLERLEHTPDVAAAKRRLCRIVAALERKTAIPQVRERLPLLRELQTEAFWAASDALSLERMRKALRGLMVFLDKAEAKDIVVTDLTDTVLSVREGDPLEAGYDFEAYHAKVNRYIHEHGDMPAIHKLTHNLPLTQDDYRALERVLTEELGGLEEYRQTFGDTPFGLLIRKIAKLDHEAALQAFSAFINDQSLNSRQIAFVHKVIQHIELNGYVEDLAELTQPPFDRPVGFVKLFDERLQDALLATIRQVRENAVHILAS